MKKEKYLIMFILFIVLISSNVFANSTTQYSGYDFDSPDFTKIFIINLLITTIGYCTVPIILRLKNGKYEYEKGKKIVIINSIVVCLSFTIMSIAQGGNGVSIAVFFYHYINKYILLMPKKESETVNNENQDIVYNEDIQIIEQNLEQKESVNVEEKIKRYKILYIIIIIMCLILTAFLIYNFSANDIEEIKDSVVMIKTYDIDDNLLSTGSGFCAFENNYIVTNFHVIEGAYKIDIITDNKKTYRINNILSFNYQDDLAIISGNFELTPLKMANSYNLKAGEEITVIGSPKGQLNTVSTGIISNADDDYQIRITAPISPRKQWGSFVKQKRKSYRSYICNI